MALRVLLDHGVLLEYGPGIDPAARDQVFAPMELMEAEAEAEMLKVSQ